jgi:hypothetical protein
MWLFLLFMDTCQALGPRPWPPASWAGQQYNLYNTAVSSGDVQLGVCDCRHPGFSCCTSMAGDQDPEEGAAASIAVQAPAWIQQLRYAQQDKASIADSVTQLQQQLQAAADAEQRLQVVKGLFQDIERFDFADQAKLVQMLRLYAKMDGLKLLMKDPTEVLQEQVKRFFPVCPMFLLLSSTLPLNICHRLVQLLLSSSSWQYSACVQYNCCTTTDSSC